LGHLNYPACRALYRSGQLEGKTVKLTATELVADPPICDACAQGKLTRDHFPSSDSRASEPLALVHSDLWGPAPVSTFKSSMRYLITFLDDH
ncbi:hypothetical protein F5890DRAFT_1393002, partial [Lentinula detonsa]